MIREKAFSVTTISREKLVKTNDKNNNEETMNEKDSIHVNIGGGQKDTEGGERER